MPQQKLLKLSADQRWDLDDFDFHRDVSEGMLHEGLQALYVEEETLGYVIRNFNFAAAPGVSLDLRLADEFGAAMDSDGHLIVRPTTGGTEDFAMPASQATIYVHLYEKRIDSDTASRRKFDTGSSLEVAFSPDTRITRSYGVYTNLVGFVDSADPSDADDPGTHKMIKLGIAATDGTDILSWDPQPNYSWAHTGEVTIGDGVASFGQINDATDVGIQKAITAFENAGVAGSIFIKKGTYTLAANFDMSTQDNITIRGEGWERTILTGALADEFVFNITGLNAILIEDMNIINTGTGGTLPTGCVSLNGGTTRSWVRRNKLECTAGDDQQPISVVEIENCEEGFNRLSENEIRFQGSTGTVIRQSWHILATAASAATFQCTHNFVYDNIVHWDRNGLAITGSSVNTGHAALGRLDAVSTIASGIANVYWNQIHNNTARFVDVSTNDNGMIHHADAVASGTARVEANMINNNSMNEGGSVEVAFSDSGAGTKVCGNNLFVMNLIDTFLFGGTTADNNGIQAQDDAEAWDGASATTGRDWNKDGTGPLT